MTGICQSLPPVAAACKPGFSFHLGGIACHAGSLALARNLLRLGVPYLWDAGAGTLAVELPACRQTHRGRVQQNTLSEWWQLAHGCAVLQTDAVNYGDVNMSVTKCADSGLQQRGVNPASLSCCTSEVCATKRHLQMHAVHAAYRASCD
jgi:hypothetical protein